MSVKNIINLSKDKKQGLVKEPLLSIGAVKASPTPVEGEIRQILDKLPEIVLYTFNGSATTGLAADDGTPGKWNLLESSKINDIYFATKTELAAIDGDNPTEAEIKAKYGAKTDTIIRYTGTDVATDKVTYSYYVDKSGEVIQIERPGSVPNDIYFATKTELAAIDGDNPTEAEIKAKYGVKTDTIIRYTGTDVATDKVTYSYYVDKSGEVIQIEKPASLVEYLHVKKSDVTSVIDGKPTFQEIKTWNDALVKPNKGKFLYFTNDDTANIEKKEIVWFVDANGDVAEIEYKSVIGFVKETEVTPAAPGEPTLAEIIAVVKTKGYRRTVVKYTGTEADTDVAKTLYWVDEDSNVIKIKSETKQQFSMDVSVVNDTLLANSKITVTWDDTPTLTIEDGAGVGINLSPNKIVSSGFKFKGPFPRPTTDVDVLYNGVKVPDTMLKVLAVNKLEVDMSKTLFDATIYEESTIYIENK